MLDYTDISNKGVFNVIKLRKGIFMKKVGKNELVKLISQAETKLKKAKEQLGDTSADNRAVAAKTLLTLSSDILLLIVSRQPLEYRQEIIDEIADILDISDL